MLVLTSTCKPVSLCFLEHVLFYLSLICKYNQGCKDVKNIENNFKRENQEDLY